MAKVLSENNQMLFWSEVKKFRNHSKNSPGKDVISGHLSILFTAMLWHGFSPDDMLKSTMVPIPKGRWANLSMSSNFRAITLGSILGKVFELLIMTKEVDKLYSTDLQFGYKGGLSTTLCTSMVQP